MHLNRKQIPPLKHNYPIIERSSTVWKHFSQCQYEGVIVQLWIDESTEEGLWSVCVCVLWQMALTVRSRQRGLEYSAPARARPTCGCSRRVSTPWPACIFRAQSYIEIIANVGLIALLGSENLNAGNIKDAGVHRLRKLSDKDRNRLLKTVNSRCKHTQRASNAAVATVWHIHGGVRHKWRAVLYKPHNNFSLPQMQLLARPPCSCYTLSAFFTDALHQWAGHHTTV